MSLFLKALQDGGALASIFLNRRGRHQNTLLVRVISSIRKIAVRLLWILRYCFYWTQRQHVQQVKDDPVPVDTQLASGHSCYIAAPVLQKPPRCYTLLSRHDAPTQLTTGLIAEERHEQSPLQISQPVHSTESLPLSQDTAVKRASSSDQCAVGIASSTKSLSETSNSPSHIGPLFYPVPPTQFERYQRPFVVRNKFIPYTIPRVTVEFSSRQLPAQWECFSHPEGASYFRCQHKLFTVFTDAHLDQQDLHIFLGKRIQEIVSYISLEKQHSDLASIEFETQNVDLVLDVTLNDEGEDVCGYYLVYHKRRAVFWLDDFDASGTLWPGENGVESMDHIQHEIQSIYWLHCSYFPAALHLTRDIIQELRDILLHAIGDTLISPTAISEFSSDDLCRMLELLDCPHPETLEQNNHGLSRIVYVLLKMFAHGRFINFHGQPDAHLDIGVLVYDKWHAKPPDSPFFGILRCLLFNAPYIQLREIQRTLTRLNCVTSPWSWKEFMSKLRQDWNEVTIYSTLIINANVAFLAIQSVDETKQGGNSPVRIPIYISMISALGSLLFSLLLLRHTKRKATVLNTGAELTQSFLRGNEQLAVLYSLPYGLMMWSVVEFIVGFLTMCFWNTALLTRIVTGVFAGLVACLIAFHVWFFGWT